MTTRERVTTRAGDGLEGVADLREGDGLEGVGDLWDLPLDLSLVFSFDLLLDLLLLRAITAQREEV